MKKYFWQKRWKFPDIFWKFDHFKWKLYWKKSLKKTFFWFFFVIFPSIFLELIFFWIQFRCRKIISFDWWGFQSYSGTPSCQKNHIFRLMFLRKPGLMEWLSPLKEPCLSLSHQLWVWAKIRYLVYLEWNPLGCTRAQKTPEMNELETDKIFLKSELISTKIFLLGKKFFPQKW